MFGLLPYDEPLFRPPSEARSLILQPTIGCSHNRCSFCSMYRSKRFRPRALEELQVEIAAARRALGPTVPRVFLADGDALCLSMRRLRPLLAALGEAFPRLQRVSAYANARDVARKSDDELSELRQLKLRLLYLGLESGDDQTLAAVDKGATAAEIVRAVRRVEAAGISTSVMVLVGLAGRDRSLEHARASAAALSEMEPTYTALLTYTPTPGSPLGAATLAGRFTLPDALGSLREIREVVGHVRCRTYFTCTHASNYLPLRGTLPEARAELLELLDAALAGELPLRPEGLRGL